MLPFIAKAICAFAGTPAESVITNSGVYVPWPPINGLVISPEFASIVSPSGSGVAGIIGLFVWEWRQKEPLINLRLFRYRNFAICCFLMMLVGGVLNANTVLQPQFTQQLLGYTATTAGLALTYGGLTLVFMMPLAGIATGRMSARYLAAFGFLMLVITFRYAAVVTNLQMSFAEASWLRVVQMFPLPFCFISITNAAYVGMPKEQSNQVAGLINFVRNIGGSILKESPRGRWRAASTCSTVPLCHLRCFAQLP